MHISSKALGSLHYNSKYTLYSRCAFQTSSRILFFAPKLSVEINAPIVEQSLETTMTNEVLDEEEDNDDAA